MLPVRRGDAGAVVADVRSKLASLGLLPVDDLVADAGTAFFDQACELAVRSFQQRRGLLADGVVSASTYRALDEARWRLGDRVLHYQVGHPLIGDDVAALQGRLQDLGFECGRRDGIFGAETSDALREFQRNVGLVPDGLCGPATLHALRRLARTVVGGRPDALRESEQLRRSGPALHNKVVVIDPGHGGDDHGVSAAGVAESELVFDLATRIERRLTATGMLAFLTRGEEMGLPDGERAAFANAAEADLLVSLHCDGLASPEANGVSTWYFGVDERHTDDNHRTPLRGSATGERLARLVHREVCARTDLLDCGVHAAAWDMLRLTRMPAVRLELGYLTSAHDRARLEDPSFRDEVAEGVVAAIQRLYLPEDSDAPTGTLSLAAIRAALAAGGA